MKPDKILTGCDDRDSSRNYGRTCLQMFPRQPFNWCEPCQLRAARQSESKGKTP